MSSHHISDRRPVTGDWQSMALQLKQMGIRDLAMGLIAYQLEQAQKAKPNEMIETWTVDMSTYRQLTADPFSPGTL